MRLTSRELGAVLLANRSEFGFRQPLQCQRTERQHLDPAGNHICNLRPSSSDPAALRCLNVSCKITIEIRRSLPTSEISFHVPSKRTGAPSCGEGRDTAQAGEIIVPAVHTSKRFWRSGVEDHGTERSQS